MKEVEEKNNMPVITNINNTANVLYNGSTITSNSAETNILLNPTITKEVDKETASIGEVVTYTVTITNPSEVEISDIVFSDVLPAGVSYIDGSFEVNGSPVTPTVSNNTLTYSVTSIGTMGSVVLEFQATVIGGEI